MNALSLYAIATEHRAMVERLMGKADVTESCWNWKAGVSKNGYGAIRFQRKQEGAHRVSYIVFKGPIPDGQHVMHRCDNKACINPEHLSLGTRSDNMKDMVSKGRNYVPAHFRGSTNPSAIDPTLRKGSRNGRAKLTGDQAKEIRILVDSGRSFSEVAEAFKVSRHTVRSIARRMSWAD